LAEPSISNIQTIAIEQAKWHKKWNANNGQGLSQQTWAIIKEK